MTRGVRFNGIVSFFLLISALLVQTRAFLLAPNRASHGAKLVANAVSTLESSLTSSVPSANGLEISFSHIHLYVDHLEDLAVYKELESKLNKFHTDSSTKQSSADWDEGCGDFVSYNRDIVKQLLVGTGMRVTGCRYPSFTNEECTRSVLVTSRDPSGVQFLVSANEDDTSSRKLTNEFPYFDQERIQGFIASHSGVQGIAVLAFEANNVDQIHDNYLKTNEKLIASYSQHDESTGSQCKVLEVYAYYVEDSSASTRTSQKVDPGTVLRFVERTGSNEGNSGCLPGIDKVEAQFHKSSRPVYCDHWVSNVFSRTDFLETLHETLGFVTKVDFNAGIVAAGEAQIESTVIGNNSPFSSPLPGVVLKDQSQVYLPINNALSSAGHVSQFLQEYGQGIQHIASRVENLVEFVSECNRIRKITGEGFSFLNIPRSYYGILTASYLATETGTKSSLATLILEACRRQSIVGVDDSVDISITAEEILQLLESDLAARLLSTAAYNDNKKLIAQAILRSRYQNLSSFLGQRFSDDTYLGIVKNQILVDVQGDDILFQIFTSNILQREEKDEAPFLEFIQRVCSVDELDTSNSPELRAGCGGFGIRNFLTLFLSIEMNKAIRQMRKATIEGDTTRQTSAKKQIDCLTQQMHDSNPILETIADAMAEEGKCELFLKQCGPDDSSVQEYTTRMQNASERKIQANQALKECSSRYNLLMKSIREEEENQS